MPRTSKINIDSIEEGDIVIVRNRDLGRVKGFVDEVDEEGKNGIPTISYTLHPDDEEGYWCYLDQILEHSPIHPR